MLRTALAIIAALAANIAVVMAGETIGYALYPIATGDMTTLTSRMPLPAKLIVVASWALAALAAATAAMRIGKRRWLAYAGAGWTLAGVVASVASFPHPLWMVVAGVALPVLAAFLADRLTAGPSAGTTRRA